MVRCGPLLAIVLALAAPNCAAAGVWLEDLDLAPVAPGYGRPQVRAAITGKPLTLHGTVFPHGVGGHADFAMWIDLKGAATRFTSTVGVDDAAEGKGTVRFQVWVDGRKAADTGVLRGGGVPKEIDVPLRGARTMALVATSAGDGIAYDHADWANARIETSGALPATSGPPRERAMILTPKPSPAPRINGPAVFGVRPGHPFLFSIAATGRRPMAFSARGLPRGLTLDPRTGRITGSLKRAGTYRVVLEARNALGRASRPFRIVAGPTLALTPPMGWNSWYVLLDRVTDQDIRAAADAMVRTGLAQHGYSYVNIDDCWAVKPGSSVPGYGGTPRDAEGRINANRRFPDMPALARYVHAKGLKIGIYTSPGPLTCAGFVGSYQHEEQDARRFADWGFDFLKYDWCSYTSVAPKDVSEADRLQQPYRRMGAILARQDRDIVYNLCQYGMGDVWKWGAQVGGNSWRTTGDLGATTDLFHSLSAIGFGQNGLERYAGPGRWNDPDYLMIGWITWHGKLQPTPLTPNEQYTYVSLWSLLAAPLFLSGDMTRLDDFTLGLLTNDEVIAVDQDPRGIQGRRVSRGDDTEVWAKPLEDGSVAVGLFNRGEGTARITARWGDLGISGPRIVRDLWRQKDLGTWKDAFGATVPRHGVVFVRLRVAH